MSFPHLNLLRELSNTYNVSLTCDTPANWLVTATTKTDVIEFRYVATTPEAAIRGMYLNIFPVRKKHEL